MCCRRDFKEEIILYVVEVQTLNVYFASDHAGFYLKNILMEQLQCRVIVVDLGPKTATPCDYPLYAQYVCEQVLNDVGSLGILICGTGIGMSMAANRIKGIRAALCTSEFQARATRLHNDANILCLGERITGKAIALEIANLFLITPFEGGRHLQRISLFD